MFTGIVETIGKVGNIVEISGQTIVSLYIKTDLCPNGMGLGDSISVNGACLTVTTIKDDGFTVDVTPETLKRTNLGNLIVDSPVNLERSLAYGSNMGGHILQGHVDTKGEIMSLKSTGNSSIISIRIPKKLLRYIVEKGFIGIDGISLTAVKIFDRSFTVSVIPYTMSNTVFHSKTVGDLVNIEVDILAKYVESLLYSRYRK
jgi:riboflavin synthase